MINLFIDRVIQMKAMISDVGMEMYVNGGKWVVNIILFVHSTVLIAVSEYDLEKLVNVFDTICNRQKLKQNQGNDV